MGYIEEIKENSTEHKVTFTLTSNIVANCYSDLMENESIVKVTKIFDKYNISWHVCDTVLGSFNLNQEWIEISHPIKAYVCWDGVYPVDWSEEDLKLFKNLVDSGKIFVRVNRYDDEGNWIAENH